MTLLELFKTTIGNISGFSLIVSICVNFILAIIVIHNDKKSSTNRLYSLLCLNLSLWLVTMYASTNLSNTPEQTLLLARLTLFFAAPLTLVFFLFAKTTPHARIQLKKISLWASIVTTAIIMIVAISPFAFTDVSLNGTFKAIPGWGLIAFGALTIFFSVSAVLILFKKLRQSSGQTRKQYQYIMIGLLLMTGLITLTIFFPILLSNNQSYVPLAPLYALIFLAMTAYSIVHHKLFDIKILATEVFVTILSIIFFARLFSTEDFNAFVVEASIFLSTVFFGYLLIKSVTKEVEQKDLLARLNRRLKRSNMRLEELLQMKTEFVGIVSHQLRTPLTVLRGLLDMQLKGDFDGLPQERVKEMQSNMLKSAVRLNSLINDLMDMTMMEGGITLKISEVNLEELITEIKSQLKEDFEKKKLEVKIEAENKVPPIEGDSKYLHEALTNIIDNAEKYTPEGGIFITLKTIGGNVCIQIKDTGIGLTEEDKKKLFQKFTRGDRSPTVYTEGTGLGLYIVKRIIEAHNGHIRYESEGENKGTTVTVTLPLRHEN